MAWCCASERNNACRGGVEEPGVNHHPELLPEGIVIVTCRSNCILASAPRNVSAGATGSPLQSAGVAPQLYSPGMSCLVIVTLPMRWPEERNTSSPETSKPRDAAILATSSAVEALSTRRLSSPSSCARARKALSWSWDMAERGSGLVLQHDPRVCGALPPLAQQVGVAAADQIEDLIFAIALEDRPPRCVEFEQQLPLVVPAHPVLLEQGFEQAALGGWGTMKRSASTRP